MHSDARGSSGSNKPVEKDNPDWVDYNEEEVEDLIVKLSQDGLEPAQIGLRLRDQYGIPSVKQVTDKKVTEILEEKGEAPEIPSDLQNLLDKAENLKEHLDENENDSQAERRLELTEAKIRSLADYYRDEGEIPENWEYERDE